jgi:HPt (histidine-containing phosphotransfer) domain-containing protein
MSDSERSEQVIDWPAALEGAAEDKELLGELVTIFLDEYQNNLSDIRKSLNEGDALLLKRAAHTLKGSLRIFKSVRAQELSHQLEQMGANESMDGAEPVLAELQEQMKLVRAELERGYHE